MTEQNLQFVTTAITIDGIITQSAQPTQPTQPQELDILSDPIYTDNSSNESEQNRKHLLFYRDFFVVFENGVERHYSSQKELVKEITKSYKQFFKIYSTTEKLYIKLTKNALNGLCEEYKQPKISKLRMKSKSDGTELTV